MLLLSSLRVGELISLQIFVVTFWQSVQIMRRKPRVSHTACTSQYLCLVFNFCIMSGLCCTHECNRLLSSTEGCLKCSFDVQLSSSRIWQTLTKPSRFSADWCNRFSSPGEWFSGPCSGQAQEWACYNFRTIRFGLMLLPSRFPPFLPSIDRDSNSDSTTAALRTCESIIVP